MDSSTFAFLLLSVGVALLAAEVFIPSGGMISIAAAISLIAAVICAVNAWWGTQPTYFWSFIAGMAVLLPVVVGVAFYVWPNTPIGKRAILEAPRAEEVASFVELEERYSKLVGKTAQTATTLNPAGIIVIDGQRIHCQSEGIIIEPRTTVRIVAVQGNRVVVRVSSPDATNSEPENGNQTAQSAQEQPLDFDLS